MKTHSTNSALNLMSQFHLFNAIPQIVIIAQSLMTLYQFVLDVLDFTHSKMTTLVNTQLPLTSLHGSA